MERYEKYDAYHGVTFLHVENIPQINQNGEANCEECEKADHFTTKSARQEYTG